MVVIGAGEAKLHYRIKDKEGVIEDAFENLVYIPPGVPHWVTNADQERISVVAVNDAQLAAGLSAVRQKVNNALGIEVAY